MDGSYLSLDPIKEGIDVVWSRELDGSLYSYAVSPKVFILHIRHPQPFASLTMLLVLLACLCLLAGPSHSARPAVR